MTHTHAASPWHAGEIAMQRRNEAVERMAAIGPHVIRDHMIAQHRAFYPLLPFVVLGSVDGAGDVWATLRAGEPGFLDAPDPVHLTVSTATDRADPAEAGLEDGYAVALLGIDLTTRRRNRLTGTVRRTGPGGFVIDVEHSFGNCPKYIHLRSSRFVRAPGVPSGCGAIRTHRLDPRARAIVARADTVFVATFVDREPGRRQVDVSHRGGPAGFVRIDADGVLTIPDYPGNMFFNTLGNIIANPRAGLVFVDFSTGDLLQMTGDAAVLEEAAVPTGVEGAERLWRFRPRVVTFRADALPLRFTPAEAGALAAR